MRNFLIFAVIFVIAIDLSGQRTCGTMEFYHEQLKKYPELKNKMEALDRHTSAYKITNRDDNVITIPVVFHVIHDGDAVGFDENISDALILANLQQLNDDFAKLNSDFGLVPSAFAGLAADTKIQFCLAERDPDCQSTTGIIRHDLGQYEWGSSDIANVLQPGTIWDRDNYMNVWTVRFGGSISGLLGFAQFPGGPALTDGVVVTYKSVGSLDVPNPENWAYGNGRTLSHEVGHWLNLRHIWGDDAGDPDECAGSDLVADTPNQAVDNGGCPTFPHITCSNGPNGDMFMNYMDYVDDQCMQMFSQGQKTRMRAVLEGGDRSSLASSSGCTAPDPLTCYCSAGASSLQYEKISNITFAGINNSSNSTAGYENFMNMTANVNKNQTYSFSASITDLDVDDLLVWIDFNRDGDFTDAGEEIINTSLASSIFNGSIAIPNSAQIGLTGMRVRLYYTPTDPNNTPCGLSGWGQVEDYTVNISVALPVDLLSFDAKVKDLNIILDWQIENEKDIDNYVVEIAGDELLNFKSIGALRSKGRRNYNFTITDLSSGNYYIRLKINDKDGNFSYSPIKSVSVGSKLSSIFPNPANNKITIICTDRTKIKSVSILDMLGRIIDVVFIDQNEELTADINNLPSGIYFVSINYKDSSENLRLVIER